MKDEQRIWLRSLVKITGLTLTQIARKASLADSTLTRFVNNEGVKHLLSSKTIGQIEKAVGVPFGHDAFRVIGRSVQLPDLHFAESFEEVVQLHANSGGDALSSLLAALPGSLEPWRIQGTALDVAGYRAGDVVLVDRVATPARKDVVLVEFDRGARLPAVHALRIYEPPFITTASFDLAAASPELIDDARVRPIGVVQMLLRTRRSDVVA